LTTQLSSRKITGLYKLWSI